MFGLSFGELLVLLLVSVIVLGPKELPRYLRKAGQFAGRMRTLAFEMRAKSGIDEVLRTEGLDRDIAEIRQLARMARGELTGVANVVRAATGAARVNDVMGSPYSNVSPNVSPNLAPAVAATPGTAPGTPGLPGTPGVPGLPALDGRVPAVRTNGVTIEREREYPREGADGYGALPDTAVVYDMALAPSPLADDPLYAHGHAGDVRDAPDAHEPRDDRGSRPTDASPAAIAPTSR